MPIFQVRSGDRVGWIAYARFAGCLLPTCLWLLICAMLMLRCSLAQAATPDCNALHQTSEYGSAQMAPALGGDYTRLAFEARGEGVFYSGGLLLVSSEQATTYLVAVRTDPKQAGAWNPIESLWRLLGPALEEVRGLLARDNEQSRSLHGYLQVHVNSCAERVLAILGDPSSLTPQAVEEGIEYLVLLLAMLDALAPGGSSGQVASGTAQAAADKAMAWVLEAGQAGRAIARSQARQQFGVACAICRAFLTRKPDDPEARKQLVQLVSGLCKAQQVQQALNLCDWAKDITQDPTYNNVLVLQQALVVGREHKNHALAIRLCDEVAVHTAGQETALLAKYMAASFCLEMKAYADAVRRMEALAREPSAGPAYRLKASQLGATAYTRQGRSDQAVRLLSDALRNLAEPEPAEAAECRQLLSQALLALQRYDEAAGQCRLLIARHPGHPAARSASNLLQQMDKKAAATATSKSEKQE